LLTPKNVAKILEPIKNAHPKIPVEILALPKAKDAPPEAMNAFIALLGNAVSMQRRREGISIDNQPATDWNAAKRGASWQNCHSVQGSTCQGWP